MPLILLLDVLNHHRYNPVMTVVKLVPVVGPRGDLVSVLEPPDVGPRVTFDPTLEVLGPAHIVLRAGRHNPTGELLNPRIYFRYRDYDFPRQSTQH